MSVWTPDAITALIIQLVALAGAVTAVIAAIQKLRGDVQQNTATTAAAGTTTAKAVADVHAALTDPTKPTGGI